MATYFIFLDMRIKEVKVAKLTMNEKIWYEGVPNLKFPHYEVILAGDASMKCSTQGYADLPRKTTCAMGFNTNGKIVDGDAGTWIQ